MRRLLLNTVSLALAASAMAAVSGVGAFAQEDGLKVEGNVALVSDYRFRGVSLSDRDPAIQGGFDLALPSGFYVGTWGSSIQSVGSGNGSEIELDAYAGYGFETGAAKFDVGLLSYNYPGSSSNIDYYEVYGSVGSTFGSLEATLGANYAWEQSNVIDPLTGNEDDNTYVYLTGSLPITGTPLSLSATVGYETGPFAFLDDNDEKLNWEIGVSTTFIGLDLGLTYVDTDIEDTVFGPAPGVTDGGVVFSISKTL